MSASGASSSPPTAVQIREANAHLAALHERVAELERRLAAAEGTVRGQAESLIRKDAEMRQAVLGLRQGKDREIATLEERLQSSEANTQKLLHIIQEKDSLIGQLRHRSRLLSKICRSRPVLDNLLAYMAEGERLSPVLPASSPSDRDPLPETDGLPDLELDARDFSLSGEDDPDSEILFGTTV
uniref:Vimentin-type intermediate filament-associated coiled-coil protein n=1 Tax=Pogona vitticeps TaxID=103695 RepID=A0A6J0SPD6_9SAUR